MLRVARRIVLTPYAARLTLLAPNTARTEVMADDVSILRLNILRATYLLVAGGLMLFIWPGIIDPPLGIGHMASVVRSLLGALGLLALLGLRYPLAMLPLLLFELTWKFVWVLSFGLPAWAAGRLDPPVAQTLAECLFGLVLLLLVIPWRHVFHTCLEAPAERWRSAAR